MSFLGRLLTSFAVISIATAPFAHANMAPDAIVSTHANISHEAHSAHTQTTDAIDASDDTPSSHECCISPTSESLWIGVSELPLREGKGTLIANPYQWEVWKNRVFDSAVRAPPDTDVISSRSQYSALVGIVRNNR